MEENVTNKEDLNWVNEHCLQEEKKYPDVITPETGLDIVIPNHPEFFVVPPRDNIVKIEIDSFIGLTTDAVHYYGTIRYAGPRIASKNDEGRIVTHLGYICQEFKEMAKEQTDIFSGVNIKVSRIVTEEEVNENPDRWKGYYAGHSKTTAFNSKSELILTAKKIINIRFKGDFLIEVNELS